MRFVSADRQPFYHSAIAAPLTESRNLIRVARSAATLILEEAKTAREIAQKDAHQAGVRAGAQQIIDQLTQLSALRRRMLDLARDDVIELASRLAEELLGKTIENAETFLSARLSRLMQEVTPHTSFSLVVSPSDLKAMELAIADIFRGDESIQTRPALRTDSSLSPLAFRVELATTTFASCPRQHLSALRQRLHSSLPLPSLPDETLPQL